jgi:hypothetical protein
MGKGRREYRDGKHLDEVSQWCGVLKGMGTVRVEKSTPLNWGGEAHARDFLRSWALVLRGNSPQVFHKKVVKPA